MQFNFNRNRHAAGRREFYFRRLAAAEAEWDGDIVQTAGSLAERCGFKLSTCVSQEPGTRAVRSDPGCNPDLSQPECFAGGSGRRLEGSAL